MTVKYGVKVPGSNPGHNEVYWSLGRCWVAALVLKTRPGKTGESSILSGSAPPGDGIGRHARLRTLCRKAWEFDSPPGDLWTVS